MGQSTAFLVFACCALLASPIQAADVVTVRGATIVPTGTPWETAVDHVKRDWATNSGGRIKLKVAYSGQKGSEDDIVGACQDGQIDLIAISTAALANKVPGLQVLELPFLFDSSEEADFVLDSYLKTPVSKIVQNHGYVFVTWAENGWQGFGSRDKPILSPRDLMGVKVRSQASPIHKMAWQTFGASPIELSPTDTLEALKKGTVTVVSQTPLYIMATGWAGQLKEFTVSRHLYQPGIVVLSKKFTDTQDATTQAMLQSNSEVYAEESRRLVRAMDPELLANLTKSGVNVHTLTQEQREAFVDAARRIQNKFIHTAPQEALDLLKVVVQGKTAYARRQTKP